MRGSDSRDQRDFRVSLCPSYMFIHLIVFIASFIGVSGTAIPLKWGPGGSLVVRGRVGPREMDIMLRSCDTQTRVSGPNTVTFEPRQVQLYAGAASVSVPLDRIRQRGNLDSFRATLGFSHTSRFGRQVGGMMLVPNSSTGNITMHISPENPDQLCYENGPIAYASLVPVHYAGYTVRTRLEAHWPEGSILESNQTSIVSSSTYFATIETKDADSVIPAVIFNDIMNRARQHGIPPIHEGVATFNAPNCYTELFTILPELRYYISTTDSEVAAIIMTPSDYLISNGEQCFLSLRADRYYPPAHGTQFLKNVAVYFDYTNHRFGFCEPL